MTAATTGQLTDARTVVIDGEAAPPIDPGPIALTAFAISTFLLSWTNAGLVHASAAEAVLASAWVMGGGIQAVVGVYSITRGRLFAGVAFMLYGGLWISLALFETFFLEGVPVEERGHVLALFIAPWLIFTLYLWIAAWKTNIAFVVGLGLLWLVFLTFVIGRASGETTWMRVCGWLGLVLALEIFYIAAAELINQVFKRHILPLGELGAGRIVEV